MFKLNLEEWITRYQVDEVEEGGLGSEDIRDSTEVWALYVLDLNEAQEL